MSQIVEELNFAAVRGRSFMTSAFFLVILDRPPPPLIFEFLTEQNKKYILLVYFMICQHVSDFYDPPPQNE